MGSDESNDKQPITPKGLAARIQQRMERVGELIAAKGTLHTSRKLDERWEEQTKLFKKMKADIPVDDAVLVIRLTRQIFRAGGLSDADAPRSLPKNIPESQEFHVGPSVTLAQAVDGQSPGLAMRDHEDYKPLLAAIGGIWNDMSLLMQIRGTAKQYHALCDLIPKSLEGGFRNLR